MSPVVDEATVGGFFALGVVVPLGGVRERGADGAVACFIGLTHNRDDIVGEGLWNFTLVAGHLVVGVAELLALVFKLNNANGQAVAVHDDVQSVGAAI